MGSGDVLGTTAPFLLRDRLPHRDRSVQQAARGEGTAGEI